MQWKKNEFPSKKLNKSRAMNHYQWQHPNRFNLHSFLFHFLFCSRFLISLFIHFMYVLKISTSIVFQLTTRICYRSHFTSFLSIFTYRFRFSYCLSLFSEFYAILQLNSFDAFVRNLFNYHWLINIHWVNSKDNLMEWHFLAIQMIGNRFAHFKRNISNCLSSICCRPMKWNNLEYFYRF